MSAEPFNDEFASRYGLGVALTALTARDGTTASVHLHRTGGEAWLVCSRNDDDGGEASAAPSSDGIAVTLLDGTLLAGGTSDPEVVDVELALRDRDENVVTRPVASGAWIAALEQVGLPADLSIMERDARGGVVRERHFDFPDGIGPRLALRARALRWARRRLGLPRPVRLARGSTSYPRSRS